MIKLMAFCNPSWTVPCLKKKKIETYFKQINKEISTWGKICLRNECGQIESKTRKLSSVNKFMSGETERGGALHFSVQIMFGR